MFDIHSQFFFSLSISQLLPARFGWNIGKLGACVCICVLCNVYLPLSLCSCSLFNSDFIILSPQFLSLLSLNIFFIFPSLSCFRSRKMSVLRSWKYKHQLLIPSNKLQYHYYCCLFFFFRRFFLLCVCCVKWCAFFSSFFHCFSAI